MQEGHGKKGGASAFYCPLKQTAQLTGEKNILCSRKLHNTPPLKRSIPKHEYLLLQGTLILIIMRLHEI